MPNGVGQVAKAGKASQDVPQLGLVKTQAFEQWGGKALGLATGKVSLIGSQNAGFIGL